MPFSPGIFATLEPLQDGLINFSLVFSPSEMLFQLSWWSSPSLLCPRPSKLLLAVPQQNLHPQPASSAFCVVHNLRAFILVASAGFCRSPAPPPCSHWLLALRNAQARQTFSVEQKGNFSCCYGKDLKKTVGMYCKSWELTVLRVKDIMWSPGDSEKSLVMEIL